jgi:hypothetical protein
MTETLPLVPPSFHIHTSRQPRNPPFFPQRAPVCFAHPLRLTPSLGRLKPPTPSHPTYPAHVRPSCVPIMQMLSFDHACTKFMLMIIITHCVRTLAMMLCAGMGDICSAWVTGRSGGPESTASLDLPDTSHSHQAGSSHPSTPLQQSLLQGTRREVAQRWACTVRINNMVSVCGLGGGGASGGYFHRYSSRQTCVI